MGDGTAEPRSGEELPVAPLERYLRERLPELPAGSLRVRQFRAGASNLTYLLHIDGWEAVLRRPPFGPLPPRAHDMPREARLLQRVHASLPLAPRPYLICEDTSLLGAPFYVMERKRGVVLEEVFPSGTAVDHALCRRLSLNAIDTLASIHALDWQAAGLEDFGRPDGFLTRQVHGWIERYDRARTDDVPAGESLAAWLADHIPESPPPTLIHNDFKLNNIVLKGDDLAEPVGILDWEMATVGDPLLDLGICLSYWVQPDDPPEMRTLLPTVTAHSGFLSRGALMVRYAETSGRDLSSMPFYLTFAYFKLAGILQQIYARWRRGQTHDERFAHFGSAVTFLVNHAEATIDRD